MILICPSGIRPIISRGHNSMHIEGLHVRMRQSGSISGQLRQLARRAVAHLRPCEQLDGGLRRAPSTAGTEHQAQPSLLGHAGSDYQLKLRAVNGDIHRAPSSSSASSGEQQEGDGDLVNGQGLSSTRAAEVVANGQLILRRARWRAVTVGGE
ncbi:hypothetical protein Dimus_020688 [Dionaea muscipula]